jgi:hypothetical protein
VAIDPNKHLSDHWGPESGDDEDPEDVRFSARSEHVGSTRRISVSTAVSDVSA